MEVVPLLGGFVVGLVIVHLPGPKLVSAAAGSVCIGVLATVLSGEFRSSWAYLLFDIAAALVGIAASVLVTGAMRRRGRRVLRP